MCVCSVKNDRSPFICLLKLQENRTRLPIIIALYCTTNNLFVLQNDLIFRCLLRPLDQTATSSTFIVLRTYMIPVLPSFQKCVVRSGHLYLWPWSSGCPARKITLISFFKQVLARRPPSRSIVFMMDDGDDSSQFEFWSLDTVIEPSLNIIQYHSHTCTVHYLYHSLFLNTGIWCTVRCYHAVVNWHCLQC